MLKISRLPILLGLVLLCSLPASAFQRGGHGGGRGGGGGGRGAGGFHGGGGGGGVRAGGVQGHASGLDRTPSFSAPRARPQQAHPATGNINRGNSFNNANRTSAFNNVN